MRCSHRIIIAIATMLASVSGSCAAPITWIDGARGDPSWSNGLNWDTGIAPVSSSDVIFADPFSAGVVGVDTGATTVASISVNSGTSAFSIVPLGSDSLIVTGSFLNNSSNTVSVQLDYALGGSATLDGPIAFNSLLNVGVRTAMIAGAINVGATSLQLNNTSVSGYGRFAVGSGATLAFGNGAGSVTFSPSSTYAGSSGDIFNLVANSGGAVTGLNLALFDVNTLPTLTSGLAWNTASLGSGTLSVYSIPEPSTWALLAGSLTIVMVLRRRRQS